MTTTAQPFPVLDTEATHVVIELFGGDNNLSDFVLEDMREMTAGNTGPLVVLALADYADKGAVVVELSPRTGNRELLSLGEINTGDPATLTRFLTRALLSYPDAKHRAIGFWDHGSGVFDEVDPQARSLGRALTRPARWARGRARPARKLFLGDAKNSLRARAMLHDDTNGGLLTNREAGRVLASAFKRANVPSVDMIFSDTCLNGMVEVLAELAPYAEVIVGSEDLEPGDGWDYALWFERISAAPPQNADQWAKLAVEAFGDSYKSRTSEHPVTLAAYRTRSTIVPAIKAWVDTLGVEGEAGFRAVALARGQAQAFAQRDTYDLADFMLKLRALCSEPVKLACDAVVAAVEAARIASVAHGERVKDAQGLALFIPSSRYALSDVAATYGALAFETQTGWLAYLKQYC